MANSYKILLSCFVIMLVMFILSPWFSMTEFNNTIKENNQTQWQQIIETEKLKKDADNFLRGLADLKMYAEMQEDSTQAIKDNYWIKENISLLARKFADTKGIKHFLCGEFTNDPHSELSNKSDCWQLDGKLSWQSLTKVKVAYKNPDTDWYSYLVLERTGLFHWEAVGIELPINAIIKSFAKQVGLELKPEA